MCVCNRIAVKEPRYKMMSMYSTLVTFLAPFPCVLKRQDGNVQGYLDKVLLIKFYFTILFKFPSVAQNFS